MILEGKISQKKDIFQIGLQFVSTNKIFSLIFVPVLLAEFHFILPQTKSQFSHKRLLFQLNKIVMVNLRRRKAKMGLMKKGKEDACI